MAVVNRPGAESTAAAAWVAGSSADGHAVLVSTSAYAYAATFSLHLPYDPLDDFTPVAPLTEQPYVLVAGMLDSRHSLNSSPSRVRDPGSLRFGSTGTGTATYVGMEVLKRELGIEATHIRTTGEEGIADTIDRVLAGETDLVIAPIAITLLHLRDGTLVPLGVTTARRSRVIPEVFTLAEARPAGFRFDFPIWYGTWVPSKTPTEIVRVLAGAICSALAEPELRKWLIDHDGDPFAMSQSEFAMFARSQAEMAMRVAPSGE